MKGIIKKQVHTLQQEQGSLLWTETLRKGTWRECLTYGAESQLISLATIDQG
jgi:hypothetical protein